MFIPFKSKPFESVKKHLKLISVTILEILILLICNFFNYKFHRYNDV